MTQIGKYCTGEDGAFPEKMGAALSRKVNYPQKLGTLVQSSHVANQGILLSYWKTKLPKCQGLFHSTTEIMSCRMQVTRRRDMYHANLFSTYYHRQRHTLRLRRMILAHLFTATTFDWNYTNWSPEGSGVVYRKYGLHNWQKKFERITMFF